MNMSCLGIYQQYPLAIVFNLSHETYHDEGVFNWRHHLEIQAYLD